MKILSVMFLFPKLVRSLLDEDDLVRLDALAASLLSGPPENTGSASRTPWSESRKQLERHPAVARRRIRVGEEGISSSGSCTFIRGPDPDVLWPSLSLKT